jgi:hydrogenase/urease accessory protein HupE
VFFKFFFLSFFLSSFLQADLIRPVYLEVIQKTTDSYALLLKVPVKGDNAHPMKVKAIEGCKEKGTHITESVNGSYKDRYTLVCSQGLKGKIIEVQGLENTKRDLLLRMEFLNGGSQSTLLNPAHNTYIVKENTSSIQVIQTYTWLGITHILMGFDHLCFVFLLLLIVKNMRRLLWTITAFTLAHSITMAGATLGIIHIPQQPVEAIIALSILFLAMEIVHEKQGKVGLASQYPWLIAFIFGLLHGFGFAGALAEIGLPQQAITLALIFFNIGVELGQLMFVATVVFVAMLLHRLNYPKFMERVEMFVVYGIGGLSAFWVFERISAF